MIPCVSTPSGCKENSRGFSEIVFLSPGEHRHDTTDICLHFRGFTFADFLGFSCLSCEVQHSFFRRRALSPRFARTLNVSPRQGYIRQSRLTKAAVPLCELLHLHLAPTVLMSIRFNDNRLDCIYSTARDSALRGPGTCPGDPSFLFAGS